MDIRVFDVLPEDAALIRREVFMDEQGFRDEFDNTDGICEHYVMYLEDGYPAAVCRTYISDGAGVIGRVAVRRPFRGRGFGRGMIAFAEDHLRESGTARIILHAQTAASGFYASMGYQPFGEEDDDEGVPHIWMEKML